MADAELSRSGDVQIKRNSREREDLDNAGRGRVEAVLASGGAAGRENCR